MDNSELNTDLQKKLDSANLKQKAMLLSVAIDGLLNNSTLKKEELRNLNLTPADVIRAYFVADNLGSATNYFILESFNLLANNKPITDKLLLGRSFNEQDISEAEKLKLSYDLIRGMTFAYSLGFHEYNNKPIWKNEDAVLNKKTISFWTTKNRGLLLEAADAFDNTFNFEQTNEDFPTAKQILGLEKEISELYSTHINLTTIFKIVAINEYLGPERENAQNTTEIADEKFKLVIPRFEAVKEKLSLEQDLIKKLTMLETYSKIYDDMAKFSKSLSLNNSLGSITNEYIELLGTAAETADVVIKTFKSSNAEPISAIKTTGKLSGKYQTLFPHTEGVPNCIYDLKSTIQTRFSCALNYRDLRIINESLTNLKFEDEQKFNLLHFGLPRMAYNFLQGDKVSLP